MLKVKELIIVEGKYDKNAVRQAVDAVVIDTKGFGIFSDSEKLSLIRRLAKERGIILLTDSDGAGFLIRNYLKGAIDGAKIKNAYIPELEGKERRKERRSAEGFLGVEGMTREIIIDTLKRAGATFAEGGQESKDGKIITKTRLYLDGFSGRENSYTRRARLIDALDLPGKITTNALIEVLNILFTLEQYEEFVKPFKYEK